MLTTNPQTQIYFTFPDISQRLFIFSSPVAPFSVKNDEYEVEKVLENWLEFLHQQIRGEENFYSFYHTSFQNWLAELKHF